MYSLYNDYEIVQTQFLELVDWKDRITLRLPVRDTFDAVHIRSITYITDDTGLKTLAIHIKNLDCNRSVIQNLLGTEANTYCALAQLDPTGPNSIIYFENPYPPIKLPKEKNTYDQFEYEIYVNNETSYNGITSLNPVMIQLSFLRSKYLSPRIKS